MGGKTLFWFGVIALTLFIVADYIITRKERRYDKNND